MINVYLTTSALIGCLIPLINSCGLTATAVYLPKDRPRFQHNGSRPAVTIVTSRFCTRTADSMSALRLRKQPNLEVPTPGSFHTGDLHQFKSCSVTRTIKSNQELSLVYSSREVYFYDIVLLCSINVLDISKCHHQNYIPSLWTFNYSFVKPVPACVRHLEVVKQLMPWSHFCVKPLCMSNVRQI